MSHKIPTKIKRDKFVALYVADPKKNGAKCAELAGWAKSGARVTACNLLKDPEIRKAIMEKEQELLKKYDMTADSVMKELASLVHFDVRKLYNEDGTLKAIHELDDATARALSSIQVVEEVDTDGDEKNTTTVTKTFKVFDKNSAIEKAMKHFKLLGDNGPQIGSLTIVLSQQDIKLG